MSDDPEPSWARPVEPPPSARIPVFDLIDAVVIGVARELNAIVR